MTGVPAPAAPTHSLVVDLLDLVFYLRCRDCGSRWKVGPNIPADIGDRVGDLEQESCGGELCP